MNQSPNLNNLNDVPAMNPTTPVQPVQNINPVPTVQPVNNAQVVPPVQPVNNAQVVPPVQPVNNAQVIPPVQAQPTNNVIIPNVQDLQYIPTVEQTNEEFINNTQATTKKEEPAKNSEGINMTFVIIIFVLILAAVFFVFPYIFDHM